MRSILSLILLVSCFGPIFGQKGHEIKVKIAGFKGNVLYMAYHYGSKQYIRDTVYRSKDNFFIFSRQEEALAPGHYMVVIPPENKTFDLLINLKEQHFSVSTALSDLVTNMSFKGKSNDNKLFYGYLNFLNKQRAKLSEVKPDQSETEKTTFQNTIDKEVRDYQTNLIKNNPNTLAAAIIKAGLPIDYPDFEGSDEDQSIKRWRYSQKHYFDNIDLSDDALLRTAILEQRIMHYIDKLQVQHPDTIAVAIDRVLSKMDLQSENFQYFTSQFLNKYARSKIVGMDAVYVHMVDEYYGKGLTPWIDTDQLNKIVSNARRLRPLLIGKITPDLTLKKRDGSTLNLHEIESEYTILYFWKNDCGHCKKASPILQKFHDNFKNKGVKIAAVCVNRQDEVQDCWDYVDEHEIGDWIHLADPSNISDMHNKYDIRSTPQLYILDKNKKIISKRIGADQLEKIMNRIINK